MERQLALCMQTEVILTTGVGRKKRCISLRVLSAQMQSICWNGSSVLKIPIKEHAQKNPANPMLAGWTAMCPGAGEEGKKAHLDKRPG